MDSHLTFDFSYFPLLLVSSALLVFYFLFFFSAYFRVGHELLFP